MTEPSDALHTLLVVQGHDAAGLQLLHKRDHLPEQAKLSAIAVRRAALLVEEMEPRSQLAKVDAQQEELETEIARLDKKIKDVEATLYGGTISSPKELQAFEADIASLRRRRGELEDTEIELLLGREPIDAVIARGNGERLTLDAEEATLRVAMADALSVIDAESTSHLTQRTQLAATLPADLMRTYDAVRARNRGIGAAKLEAGGRCASCHLALPAVEVDRIRRLPGDAVITCDQCGAILVR